MIQKGHVLVKVCTRQYHLLHNLGQIIQRIHLLLILHHIKEPLIVQSTHKHTVAIRLIALIISQLGLLFHLPPANPTNFIHHHHHHLHHHHHHQHQHQSSPNPTNSSTKLPTPLRSQILLYKEHHVRQDSSHNTVIICHKTLRALWPLPSPNPTNSPTLLQQSRLYNSPVSRNQFSRINIIASPYPCYQ
jgi:hypothetical protein